MTSTSSVNTINTIRDTFTVQAEATAGGFEIVAMTAGKGNQWTFPADVLRASLALWEGVECFIDHAWQKHSIKDLGGLLHSVTWNDALKGIIARLRPVGPSGPLVVQLGREMLTEGRKPRVGFSADLLFRSEGKRVTEILRVLSVDCVFDPARGGAFLRALNSIGGRNMADEVVTQTPPAPPQAESSHDVEAIRSLLQVQREQAALADEAEKARAVRAQMCSYLLDSGLMASKLPTPVQDRIRAQFTGKAFEAGELTTAIEDGRKLVAQLTSGQSVAGVISARQMFSNADQLQAAVDDLFEAPREAGMETYKPHRLRGIRELYLGLTGDDDLHGGCYPERARFATTSDFSGLVKNALNKIVVDQWKKVGRAGYDWWQRITTVEHFESLNTITGTLMGTVGLLPVVSEGGEYTELAVGDSPETATFYKYGGYIPLTLELIDRDETRKLKAYPRELANAGLRRISYLVSQIFLANTDIGPQMADTGYLFNATAVTTAGGHANLLTAALAADKWELVCAAVYNQPMLIKQATGYYGTGPKMGINPRYLVVPRALQLTAKNILYGAWSSTASQHNENFQQQRDGDVVVMPEFVETDHFAAVCDPAIAPAIYVGERFGLLPEIYIAGDELSPAVFMNDEHRLKVRHFVAVWVNDFRPLHKSNV